MKTVIAAAIAIPNLALSAKYYTSVATEKGKLKKLQEQSREMEGELTRSQQLLSDRKQQGASNLLKSEGELKAAQNLKAEAQTEKEAAIKKAQKQAQAILDEARKQGEKLIEDKQAEHNQALKILAEEEQRISDERDKIIAEAEAIKAKAEESLAAANREWEQIESATKEWKKIKEFAAKEGKLEGDFAKKQAQLEADAIKTQILLEKETWESQLAQLMESNKKQILEQYREECDEEIRQEIDQEVSAIASEAKQKMLPLLKKIEELTQTEQELKERLKLMFERLQATKKPKKPKEIDQYSTTARRLIEFYEERAIMLDFVSSRPAPDGTTVVCVLPWQQDKGIEKSLESYFNALIIEFDLLLVPTWDITPLGYEIRLTPRPHHFGGNAPANPHSSQAYKFNGSPVEDTEEQIEKLAEQALGDRAAVEEVIQQRKKDAHTEAMLSFRPPSKKIEPTSKIVDPIEYQWIEWAYKWRELSINKPNLTRQSDLLLEVYGVSVGRGTDEQSLQGETLRQRLHRIMDFLELPRRSR
ncbi:MAG: hypothetical protein F6K31_34545 [Symploca sp. SIO2G7]|nr:hypothetical protein [Symploca sp. SIO2G7]